MQSIKRLIKPLAIGTLVGVGGYYAYDSYRVNLQMQKIQNTLKKQQVEIENLSSNIPALLEHEQQQIHTEHEKQDLQLQKEESYQKKIQQQLQKKQQQQLSQHIIPNQKQIQQLQTQIQQQTAPAEKQTLTIQHQQSQSLLQPTKQFQKQQLTQVQKQTIPLQNQQQQQQILKSENVQQKLPQITTEKIQQTPLIAQQQPKQLQKPQQKQEQKPSKQQKQETPLKQKQSVSELTQEKLPETIQSSSTQTTKQKPQNQQQKSFQTQINTPINLATLNKLSQLPHIPLIPQQKLKTALVVADMGFTQQFQNKLLQTIKNLKHIPQYQNIKIYRMNLNNQENLKQMQKVYGHKIKDETIFLIKNELDESFVDINFDMYMQYPTLINTYLTKLNLFKKQNQKDYLKKLQKMGPNESYLMFVYDDSEPEEKKLKSLLAAKYIEMELALHHLDHVVKVLPVEAQLAKESKVIPESKIRSKSLHIIRKHNQFTHTQPNLHLKFENHTSPYHLLADVGFHNKRGEVAIQSYLSKIQTFNSLSITTPYILSVTVDKNRITTDNYKKLMDTFRDIKRRNVYPQVGIALKFSQVGYLGKDQAQNSEFCIKLANVAELQNQSSLHEIHNIQDINNLGITEQNWLKSSNEYLYPHQAVSEQLINDFVQKALLGQIPQYYRSDKPSTIQNVHKIVASNFDRQILQNNLDHFVFQYSDHCPSCKLISPLIEYINQVLEPIPVQERFDIHVMNSQKNRVKDQVYSPYTPNMSYYKNEWKHTGPVKIGLQAIKYQGLVGLYDFCVITKLLKTIDGKKFQQAINNAKGWSRAEFLL